MSSSYTNNDKVSNFEYRFNISTYPIYKFIKKNIVKKHLVHENIKNYSSIFTLTSRFDIF